MPDPLSPIQRTAKQKGLNSIAPEREHKGSESHAESKANSSLGNVNEREHRNLSLSAERISIGGTWFRRASEHVE